MYIAKVGILLLASGIVLIAIILILTYCYRHSTFESILIEELVGSEKSSKQHKVYNGLSVMSYAAFTLAFVTFIREVIPFCMMLLSKTV